MGTNYYLHDEYATPATRRHIGKKSVGWVFQMHIYPQEGINDLADWLELMTQPLHYIRDGHDNDISIGELVTLMLKPTPNTPLQRSADEITHDCAEWDRVQGEFS